MRVCGKKGSQPMFFSIKDPLNRAGDILDLAIKSPKVGIITPVLKEPPLFILLQNTC